MQRRALLALRACSRILPDEAAACTPKLAALAGKAAPIAPTGSRGLMTIVAAGQLYAGGLMPGSRRFSSGVTYPPSEAFVGQPAPSFSATAVVDGEFKTVSLNDFKGKFVCLFFYPKDFTFVCPTEIIAFSDRATEFEELGCQLIAASTDTEESHLAWIKTPRRKGGLGHMQIPILADTTKEIAARYGCLIPDIGIALRGLYIINPEGILEQVIVNNLPIGRDVDEAKRLLQAIQYVREHGEVCPAGWKPGGDTMVADPNKSMEYFAKQDEAGEGEEMAPSLPSITSEQQLDELLAEGGPVVLDFYAPWCGKCRMISPTLESLAAAHPGLKVYKVDTTNDALEAAKQRMNVQALPTFKFFKGGKEALTEVIGYKKKPLEDAMAKLAEDVSM